MAKSPGYMGTQFHIKIPRICVNIFWYEIGGRVMNFGMKLGEVWGRGYEFMIKIGEVWGRGMYFGMKLGEVWGDLRGRVMNFGMKLGEGS
jgi:hypothetical protein